MITVIKYLAITKEGTSKGVPSFVDIFIISFEISVL